MEEADGSNSTSDFASDSKQESRGIITSDMVLSTLSGPHLSISTGVINLAVDLYQRSPARQLKKQLRKRMGSTPTSLSEVMANLVAECDLYAYQERLIGAWWNRSFYLLGAPAAVLATIAGTTSLSDAVKPIVVTVLALCSAALTTLVTFLRSDNRHDHHLQSSAAWTNLADRARILILDYGSATSNQSQNISEIDEFYSHRVVALNSLKNQLLRGDIPQELRGYSHMLDSSSRAQTLVTKQGSPDPVTANQP